MQAVKLYLIHSLTLMLGKGAFLKCCYWINSRCCSKEIINDSHGELVWRRLLGAISSQWCVQSCPVQSDSGLCQGQPGSVTKSPPLARPRQAPLQAVKKWTEFFHYCSEIHFFPAQSLPGSKIVSL